MIHNEGTKANTRRIPEDWDHRIRLQSKFLQLHIFSWGLFAAGVINEPCWSPFPKQHQQLLGFVILQISFVDWFRSGGRAATCCESEVPVSWWEPQTKGLVGSDSEDGTIYRYHVSHCFIVASHCWSEKSKNQTICRAARMQRIIQPIPYLRVPPFQAKYAFVMFLHNYLVAPHPSL